METIPNERFFNPLLGSDVRSSLFDFVDFGTASVVESQILTVISNYEPRVSDVKVNVDPRADTNEFEVTVFFNIIGQEIPRQQFSFILEATR